MNWYEWVFSGIGVAVLGYFLQRWFRFGQNAAATLTAQGAKVTGSPVASGDNISQQVSAPVIHHAEHVTFGLPAHEQLSPPKTERPVPNLVYAGGKRKSVFISQLPNEGICDPKTEEEWESAVEAFVLKFENRKPKGERKIGRALNVIAKLKFRHKNGATERDIDYGVWLNSPCNSTEIGIGDTEELVLMCVLDNKLVTFEDRRSGNRFSGYEASTYIHDGDVEDYDRIDITLIDQNSQASLSLKLRVRREGASFYTEEL
jgi:hypothetical protein